MSRVKEQACCPAFLREDNCWFHPASGLACIVTPLILISCKERSKQQFAAKHDAMHRQRLLAEPLRSWGTECPLLATNRNLTWHQLPATARHGACCGPYRPHLDPLHPGASITLVPFTQPDEASSSLPPFNPARLVVRLPAAAGRWGLWAPFPCGPAPPCRQSPAQRWCTCLQGSVEEGQRTRSRLGATAATRAKPRHSVGVPAFRNRQGLKSTGGSRAEPCYTCKQHAKAGGSGAASQLRHV